MCFVRSLQAGIEGACGPCLDGYKGAEHHDPNPNGHNCIVDGEGHSIATGARYNYGMEPCVPMGVVKGRLSVVRVQVWFFLTKGG